VLSVRGVYGAVDAAPGGFSRRWIDLLRGALEFTGAVFSDDLLMQGASGQGGVPDRARAALKAGCDLVLVCNRTDAMDEVLDDLKWKAGRHHAERVARLVPRGPAPRMDELRLSEVYRAALRDLEALADE